jgi:hypothetical protein
MRRRSGLPPLRVLVAAAALLASLCAGPAWAQTEPRSYVVPGRGRLVLDVPGDWYDEPKLAPGGVPNIRFFDRVEPPRAFEMAVSVVWSAPGASPYGSPAQVRKLVEDAAQEIAPGAQEQNLTVQEIQVDAGYGFLFRATAKNAQPGQPLHLVRGAITSGEVMMAFSILTLQRGSPDVLRALEMLKTARREAN